MKFQIITFATEEFAPQAEALIASSLDVGFTDGTVFGPDDLVELDFAIRNLQTLSQKRGAGYWLWKPFLIRRVLQNLQPSDVVFYCDAGRTNYYQFTSFPTHLAARLKANSSGFLLGPSIGHLGTIENWTKRDCLQLMKADNQSIRNKPLLMTWSLWTPTELSFRFLNAWEEFAEDPRCLTDLSNTLGKPNYECFRDHRHDQSIMSILAHKLHAPFLDFSETQVQKLINIRPNSDLGHNFYKRPQMLKICFKDRHLLS
jgi:hypothetical protein